MVKTVTRDSRQANLHITLPRGASGAIGVVMAACLILFIPETQANHQGHGTQAEIEVHEIAGPGHPIPGLPFQVYLGKGGEGAGSSGLDSADLDAAVQTVIDTCVLLLQHRSDHTRFDESLRKNVLQRVVIEPTVVNDEGKAFPFLVARTKEPGRVTLLISAASLKAKGYLNHPDRLVPVLAREFQWVVSKADTAPKPKAVSLERELLKAPVRTDQEIMSLPEDERARILQQLFDSYLRTVDDQKSLDGQPMYDVGSSTPGQPTHADSTTKLYDIRIREALQKIVREPYFQEHTPKAVRSLLNGTVWNVAFVKIDQRDWATRTRVLPEEKAVLVGEPSRRIQPAAVLVNIHRTAAADDPFYQDTHGLPMGALSADQLARVIALEIHHNIKEKSIRGHTAQDALSAPK